MPELPEVEVVRTTLEAQIKDLTIDKIECFYLPIIENQLDLLNEKIVNKKIVGIKRLAKYLIFLLDDGALVSHLRMEGKYFYLKDEDVDLKHVHFIMHLSNGYKLLYADVRKFGRIIYKTLPELYITPPLVNIGVEANNPNYDIDEIIFKLKNKTIPIKTALLDQSIISGLGNIYVDEVLFKSKINPLKKANSLTKEEIKNIMSSSEAILNKAIENKGTTIRSYTSSLGVFGNYQNYLCVHTKTICPVCNNSLEKIKIGGRSSYYCKVCQK